MSWAKAIAIVFVVGLPLRVLAYAAILIGPEGLAQTLAELALAHAVDLMASGFGVGMLHDFGGDRP